jgi:hypothetical protein
MTLPHRFGGLCERRRLCDAGIVYEYVRSATKLFTRLRERASHVLGISNVAFER